jgi:hypothetical protein
VLPRGQLARSQVQDSKDVLTAVSGHVLVSTGTVPMHLLRVCGVGALLARGFTGSSSNTRGYRVPNEVPPALICGYRWLWEAGYVEVVKTYRARFRRRYCA